MTTVESGLELRFQAPLDLCYTEINFKSKPRSFLLPRGRILRFSELIAHREFENIKERALKIYELMANNGAYCPTITNVPDAGEGMYIRWDEDLRFVMILILPGIPFGYSRGTTAVTCHLLDSDEALWPMLPSFARFVSPKSLKGVEVGQDSRRGDRGGKVG